MIHYISRRTLLAAVVALVVLAGLGLALNRARSRRGKPEVTRQSRIPSTVLWAWERPTDLKFINPNQVGVAFLARTVNLRGEEVVSRPRLQPLALPDKATIVAVVRVESDAARRPTLSQKQMEMLTAVISETARLPNVAAVQIDFDATLSEREFYRAVITEVRRVLPDTTALSITALASWCADDDWLSDLRIDEAVPMLFRMGSDRQQIRDRVSARAEFSAVACRGSYGISTDEPIANLSPEKRLYVFNPQAWTEESVRAVLESRK